MDEHVSPFEKIGASVQHGTIQQIGEEDFTIKGLTRDVLQRNTMLQEARMIRQVFKLYTQSTRTQQERNQSG
jgi:hypothetical protein